MSKPERIYSGKLVVVVAIAGAVLFTALMMVGTKGFADWLTPILKNRQTQKA